MRDGEERIREEEALLAEEQRRAETGSSAAAGSTATGTKTIQASSVKGVSARGSPPAPRSGTALCRLADGRAPSLGRICGIASSTRGSTGSTPSPRTSRRQERNRHSAAAPATLLTDADMSSRLDVVQRPNRNYFWYKVGEGEVSAQRRLLRTAGLRFQHALTARALLVGVAPLICLLPLTARLASASRRSSGATQATHR